MDFGDALILILGVASFAISIAAGKKSRNKSETVVQSIPEVKEEAQETVFAFSDDAPEKFVLQEEGVSSIQRANDIREIKAALDAPQEDVCPASMEIDKRKLIIYSELLKPKFD